MSVMRFLKQSSVTGFQFVIHISQVGADGQGLFLDILTSTIDNYMPRQIAVG